MSKYCFEFHVRAQWNFGCDIFKVTVWMIYERNVKVGVIYFHFQTNTSVIVVFGFLSRAVLKKKIKKKFKKKPVRELEGEKTERHTDLTALNQCWQHVSADTDTDTDTTTVQTPPRLHAPSRATLALEAQQEVQQRASCPFNILRHQQTPLTVAAVPQSAPL